MKDAVRRATGISSKHDLELITSGNADEDVVEEDKGPREEHI